MFKYLGRGLQHARYEHLIVVASVYERLPGVGILLEGLNQPSYSVLVVNAVSFYSSAV